MLDYYLQGGSRIHLTSADFKAQGGEGAVYVKGSTAYKIYTDPQRMISPAKVAELSVLTLPEIIRPLNLVMDGKNRPVGYAMRSVEKAFAFCQLFPPAFRRRKNLTPEKTLALVNQLRNGISYIHARGILLVDLNELNFLVAEDFTRIFFIDVDSYQTPSFPATGLMESVRDRHATGFSANTDWFSFAVLSFQLFVGIHPFKGTYPPLQHIKDKAQLLDERMRANISVLRAGVNVPSACLPFDVIPPAYLAWYRAMFEAGKRLPPPANIQNPATISAAKFQPSIIAGVNFDITEAREFDSAIIRHDGIITLTERSVYFDGKRFAKPTFEVKVAAAPRTRQLLVAYLDNHRLRLQNLTTGQMIPAALDAEEIMTYRGRLYLKQDENLCEIEFVETTRSILAGGKIVGNVMPRATQLFEGVALQNMLGAVYASVSDARGAWRQIRLRELADYRVIDAKLCDNVLCVIGARAAGLYDRLIFRFTDDFSEYDVRLARDIAVTEINFTVLESGVALLLNDEDALEIFSARKDSAQFVVIKDAALTGESKLFNVGAQAFFARGNKLYKLKMRPQTMRQVN